METIAVGGATGNQGGAVVAALLATKKYKIRALTRSPDSDKAKALAEQGVEVVKADMDDADTLSAAFGGCFGAFLVTNFWAHMDAEREIKQGKNLADACLQTGVKHVVWSTLLPDTRDLSDEIIMIGDYKVPHFDAKAIVSKYFDEIKLHVTHLTTTFYYENLLSVMKPKMGEDGVKTLTIPVGDAQWALVAVADIGKAAAHCFINDITGEFCVASDKMTAAEVAKALEDATGEKTIAYTPPYEEYRSYGFPGCNDLANMFEWYRVHSDAWCGKFSLDELKETVGVTDFKTWCEANKDALKG